jgi:aromatase
MAHIVNSIVINASYEKIFETSNDISRWREFRPQFTDAKVLEKDGNKVIFTLTHNNTMRWKAYRLLFKDEGFVYAEKLTPSLPFVYMKMVWLYRQTEEGVELTWIDDFKVGEGSRHSDMETARLMGNHCKDNLDKLKALIEKENNA